MSDNPLFTPLLNSAVLAAGQIKSFPADTVIINEDSYIKSIPIVLKGSIRVLRTEEDGKEILLYYIKPGESCIMSFLGGIHHETSKVKAVAEEDVEILMIPLEKAGEWVKDFPEWTDYIFKLYHKRFEELLGVVNAVAFQKLDQRLLQLLQQKTEVYHSKELTMTHQQLAEEVGTTREVVSRVLKQMENVGLIELGRNKITLL
jgi:CRP/FNR family transcriptional regulator